MDTRLANSHDASGVSEPTPGLGTRLLFYVVCLTLGFPPGLYLPEADAAFVDETATRMPSAEEDSYGFAVGDLDGVNGADAVVAVRGQSKLLINNGSGQFSDETAARLPVFVQTTLGVAISDVDGVNGPDIILAGSGQNRLLINDGTGNFSDESDTRLPADLSYSMDVAVADVDGDDDPDIIVANRNSRNRIWINDGSGHFSDESTTRLPYEIFASFALVLDDFDANGTLDAFVANDGQQNRFLLNNGLGVFTDNTDFALPPEIGRSSDAVSFDADGDGDPDLAVADGALGVSLYVNDGTGFFSLPDSGQIPALSEYVIRVDAADLDFDGSPDIVLGNAGQDRVLLNDGTGIFSDGTAAELPVDSRRSFGIGLIDADSDLDSDLLIATPQGQDRFYDNSIPFPRILVSTSPDYIEQGDTVSIAVDLFDEDGLDGATSPNPAVEVTQPSLGTTAATSAGPGLWTFVPTEIGIHTVTVTATDSLGNVGTKQTTFLAQAADVTDPTVTVEVDPTTIIQGQSADFTVTASDDRVVVDTTLTVAGVDVPLDVNGNASHTPLGTGLLEVVATATDAAGNTGTATTSLQVDPDTELPVVTLSASPALLDITNPISISATATDNIAVQSFGVTVTGPAGGPVDEPVVLDGAGNGTYTPFLPGDYTFAATAVDPAGNTTTETALVTAEGIPDNEAPQVTLLVVPGTTVPGGNVTLTVQATDNIFVLNRTLEINGSPIALDASYQAVYTAPVLGDYTAVATASDPTGNTASDTVVFSAVDPATDTQAPVVQITSPSQGEPVSFLQEFTGTASDLTLVEYTMAYAPTGTNDYTVFETGNQVVENGTLGTLDTTVLDNGLYDIRLTAVDINGLASEIVQPQVVEGSAKPGILQLTFVDLNVPVAGIPLAITRTYDSRIKSSGDFGVGWTMDIAQGSVTANRDVGEGWTAQAGGPFGVILCDSASEDLFHIVDLRVSDRESYQFGAKVNLDGSLGITGGCPAFVSFEYLGGDLPGATLSVIGNNDLFLPYGGDLTWDFTDPRYGNTYNPDAVRLRTIDGREFDFNWNGGNITRIADRNDNQLFITSGSITHSSGIGVSFVRDAENRITRITDPNGNELLYEYDTVGNLSAWTDQEGNRTTFEYDADSYLLNIFDPLGNRASTAEYDENGRLIALVDANGNRTVFSHQVDEQREVVVDALGNQTSYTYDDNGNVLLQEQPYTSEGVSMVAVSQFEYDAAGNETLYIDPDGITRQSANDASGNVLQRVIDPGGLNITTDHTYTASGDRLTTSLPTGEVLNYTYNGTGNPTQLQDPAGGITEFTYGGNGLPTSRVDPTGGSAELTYDSSGRMTAQVVKDVDGTVLGSEEWTYDGNGNVLTHTRFRDDGTGTLEPLITTSEYNGLGFLVRRTDPVGNVTSWEYNELGRMSAMTDPLGNRTEYTYDAVGALIRTDYADGSFEEAEYDAIGNLVATISRDGRRTSYGYDELGRPTTIALPDGRQVQKVYSAAGREIANIAANGERVEFEYDAAGRQTLRRLPEIFDAATGTAEQPEIRYEFDAAGVKSAVIDPNGNRTEYTNDFVNRVFTIELPDGSTRTRTLDAGFRLQSISDENGNTVEADYDASGRLKSITLPPAQIGDPAATYSYEYDLFGNVTAATDPLGRTRSYEYDELGRLTRDTLPSGVFQAYSYDPAGNITQLTDFDGSVTTFTYDSQNRLVGRLQSDGAAASLTYRTDGQRATVTDGRGVTSYAYDGQSRLVGITQPGVDEVSYTWDSLGRLESTTSAAGTTTYTYDEVNRLVGVSTDAGDTTYGYDSAGNHVSTTYPNGVETIIDYDAQNRPVNVTHTDSSGTQLAEFSYTRASSGKVTQITAADGSVESYTYDAIGRLIGESRTGPNAYSRTYEYDLVGNRTRQVADGVETLYSYDVDNKLTGAGATTFSYDGRGNLVEASNAGVGTTYDWDAINRLVGVTTPSGAATFGYDFEGRRVSKSTAAGDVDYLVDPINPTGYSQVIEERDGGGGLLASYSYGTDLVAMQRTGGPSYYHYDLHGSTRLLTDSSESVTDSYSYDGYGNLVGSSGSTSNNYLYTGEQFDPDASQYYLRARYYDPRVGRFTSRDGYRGEMEDPYSTHPYLYTHADPLNNIDPTGNFTLVGISISISISSGLRAVNVGQKLYSLCKIKDKIDKIEFIWGFLKGVQGARWGANFGFGGMTGLGFEGGPGGLDVTQTVFSISYEAPGVIRTPSGGVVIIERRRRDGIAAAAVKLLNKSGSGIPGGGPEPWFEASGSTFRDVSIKAEGAISSWSRWVATSGLGFGVTKTLIELEDKCTGGAFTTFKLDLGVGASVSGGAGSPSIGGKGFLKAIFFGGFADYQLNVLQLSDDTGFVWFPGW